MLRPAQVVAVHPSRRTVDLVFMDNGQRVADAPVLIGVTASDSGGWTVPSVPLPADEQQASAGSPSGRRMVALCGFSDGHSVVLSMESAGQSSVAFSEQDRACYRHPSGTYATVAPDGTIEVMHASGAHLRTGDGPTAAIPGMPAAGAGAAPTVTLKTSNVELKIAPGGNPFPSRFDFAVRPEDLSHQEPSRMQAHQTLGGAWVDAFDRGLSTITISGHNGWRGCLVDHRADVVGSRRRFCRFRGPDTLAPA